MELKLESGLPHQEYAVEAISEVFKQVEINQQVRWHITQTLL